MNYDYKTAFSKFEKNITPGFLAVKLEKGSRVNGSIFSLCSNVYKDGAVEGNSKSYQFLGFNILIPELTRLRIKY